MSPCPCTKWKDIGNASGGMCSQHGKTVSFGVCRHCPLNDGGSKWLAFRQKHRPGDKVESLTKAIGINPCGGCLKRKAYLNGDASTPPERNA